MRSLDVRPRQLSRVTGMNYETISNIAKKIAMKTGTHTQVPVPMTKDRENSANFQIIW